MAGPTGPEGHPPGPGAPQPYGDPNYPHGEHAGHYPPGVQPPPGAAGGQPGGYPGGLQYADEPKKKSGCGLWGCLTLLVLTLVVVGVFAFLELSGTADAMCFVFAVNC